MTFRNLTMFRAPLGAITSSVPAALEARPLKPVGAMELSSRGWVPPLGRNSTELFLTLSGVAWVTLGGEDKMLPSAVVSDMLEKRLAEIEQREGRRPGGRARKRIKEDVVAELLPRAFVRPSRTDAYLFFDHDLIVVDTASRRVAESVVSELRSALGSLAALPLAAGVSMRSTLTGWIAGEPLPAGLTLGDEAVLKDAADKGASIRATRQELASEEMTRHLEAGKQVTRIALYHRDHASLTLDEDLVIRKFKLLDGAMDQLESTEHDDLQAELYARFALCSGEIVSLMEVLTPALKMPRLDS